MVGTEGNWGWREDPAAVQPGIAEDVNGSRDPRWWGQRGIRRWAP